MTRAKFFVLEGSAWLENLIYKNGRKEKISLSFGKRLDYRPLMYYLRASIDQGTTRKTIFGFII